MIATLLGTIASNQTAAFAKRARQAAIAYVLAALAALCGVGFLIGAFYIWAAERYGALETAIGIGVGSLLLAGLILIIHRIVSGMRARRVARQRRVDLTAAGVATAVAILPGLLRGKSGIGILLAPALAALAYTVYRENSSHDDQPGD